MIQAEIRGHGFQPSADARTVAQFREAFVGAQENFLRDVFSFGLVGSQAHGGAKYHVLIIVQERFEVLRVGHGRMPLVQGIA